jgi:heme/copper-type cytochrome/quinol oxidase subunit 2
MMNRRDFLQLTALGGGAVFASALAGGAGLKPGPDFYFVQLSDTHWGYKGPANPEASTTLIKAVAAVNALPEQPEFIVFTGDLTHSTDDQDERRKRMREFKKIVSELKVQKIYYLPGEHDASLDRGAAFIELFGPTHYRFEHKGVNFITLDNVSDPKGAVGDEQIAWLTTELGKLSPDAPIVILTHRPLFDLAPNWDWATKDGDKVVATLMPYKNVTVFYGHIHQEHHHQTGHIRHLAAKSLVFPLPVPGSQEKRTPLPWDDNQPNKGLGFREVRATLKPAAFDVSEYGVAKTGETVVKLVAQRYHFTPDKITLKRGQPVVLAIASVDFVHGFKVPALDIRVDLPPGTVTEVRLTPQKSGKFDFLCDNFCGSGHEDMSGSIVVVD